MGRSPCCEKAHTTKEEDERLVAHIRAHGEGCWRSLPKAAGLLRCGKSCRLRWINYLRPDLKRGNFTQEEDDLIIKLHSLLGNKWSIIAGRLPGRTDNEIKNYWNTHIRRKLLAGGIDPATHRPISFGKDEDKRSSSSSSFSDESSSSSSSPQQQQQQQLPQLFRVPDLNLELRISPPEPVADDGGQMERLLCFRCSLGSSSSSSEECKCNISKDGFLGLAIGSVGLQKCLMS